VVRVWCGCEVGVGEATSMNGAAHSAGILSKGEYAEG
jgi:hypothetical protein